jgi:RimJ/RimL family protein N-acetyltransferase
MAFPDSFATERLQFDRLTADHLSEVERMHRDPAVMSQLGGVQTDERIAAYMARNLRHWHEYGFGPWVVRERGRPDIIGRAVLRRARVDEIDDVEVGYAFYESCWGRGLATELATACVGLGFEQLDLASIVGLTSPANRASQHVLEKVGLTFEREVIHEGKPTSVFRTRPRPGFRTLRPGDREPCLRLFDDNSPESFAPNERAQYEAFFDEAGGWYEVYVADGRVIAAVGLDARDRNAAAVRWLVVAREAQGRGLGRAAMSHVVKDLRRRGIGELQIAASHKSAPFFARFGAETRGVRPDGWGPGMHRIDMVLSVNPSSAR